jgi:hypothetical protein
MLPLQLIKGTLTMKFMKYITALITFTCAANSYAGFFSSSDEFKCGRDDAVKALQQYIRDGASEMLQHDSIKMQRYF